MAEPAQAREIGSSMASLALPSGGAGLELRIAADAAAVRLLLAQARHEEAAETAAALFTVCIRAGYQVGLRRMPRATPLGPCEAHKLLCSLPHGACYLADRCISPTSQWCCRACLTAAQAQAVEAMLLGASAWVDAGAPLQVCLTRTLPRRTASGQHGCSGEHRRWRAREVVTAGCLFDTWQSTSEGG